MCTHRWSGWPGAWCLDCGAPDPREIWLALTEHERVACGADPYDPPEEGTCDEHHSNRCNPYVKLGSDAS